LVVEDEVKARYIVAVVLTTCCITQSASADVPIATVVPSSAPVEVLQKGTTISAYGGRLVWSTYDPAVSAYRLTARDGGVITYPSIAPRSVPFDVDLGPGSQGETLAVYSRCAREPAEPGLGPGGTDYNLGTDCDVYAYDFGTHREAKLSSAVNSSAASEYLPTIWGRRVAFVRTYPTRSGWPLRPRLYVSAFSGRSKLKRLPGGTRGLIHVGVVRRFHFRSGPSKLDLRNQRLVFGWTYFPRSGTRLFQIRLVTTTKRTRKLIAQTGYSSGATIACEYGSPLLADAVHWAGSCSGQGGLYRYAPSTGRYWVSKQHLSAGSLAIDGEATYYAGGAEIRMAEPLSYVNTPALRRPDPAEK
jgi:hypothetical protein